jgi:hypothetical protein
MARALTLKSEGGNAFMKTISRKGLGSALSQELWYKIENPLIFQPVSGDPGHGYEATVLIVVNKNLHIFGKISLDNGGILRLY